MLEILNDPEAGTVEDKLRLIIIAMICDPAMSEVSNEDLNYVSRLFEVVETKFICLFITGCVYYFMW